MTITYDSEPRDDHTMEARQPDAPEPTLPPDFEEEGGLSTIEEVDTPSVEQSEKELEDTAQREALEKELGNRVADDALWKDELGEAEDQVPPATPPSRPPARPLRSVVSFAAEDRPRTGGTNTSDAIVGSPRRPRANHANTSNATLRTVKTAGDSQMADMPQLKRRYTRLANKEAHPMQHIGITFGLPMIVLFDIVVPCIIYYTWYNIHRSRWQRDCRAYHSQGARCPIEKPQFDKDILGYAVASFGLGEIWVLVARVWRLFFHREQCAPLLSRNRWELDATSWVYLVAVLIALIPFVVGSSLVIPKLYLYGPACLMTFLGILMVITTLHPFNIPIGINSHARGTGLRPFIYYAAEDFIAVDGLQDREFRVRYNERYESSKAFRRMFVYLTVWWEVGVLVYIGALSAVIWTLEFHIAFGLSLGILFSFIGTWAGTTVLFVNWEMDRQRKAFELGKISA